MIRFIFVLVCSLCVSSFGYVPAVRTRIRNVVSIQATNNKLTKSLRNLREKLNTPPEMIIAAVERLPEVPLSVSDVAATAGVDLNVARTELMTLASLTGGDMAVTNDGDILYSFPRNVRSILQQRSLGQKVRTTYAAASPVLFYILRVSFGLALFASLLALGSAFVVVSSSTRSSDDDKGNGNGRGRGFSFNGGLGRMEANMLTDWLFYRPYYGYYQSPRYRADYGTSSSSLKTGELTFIESFFSYVFGDGDPNETFSNDQLRYMADVIRRNDGIVVAEQLAPFLDPPPVSSKTPDMNEYTAEKADGLSVVVDESWVLPAVLQLGGMPMATSTGDIVYRFDELTNTGVKTLGKGGQGDVSSSSSSTPPMLAEKQIPFSLASTGSKLIAGGLGVLNLGGALWLGRVLMNPLLAVQEPILMGALSKLYPALMAYAVAYNVIPVVRGSLLSKKNAEIDERNERRVEWAKYLASAPASLKAKLAAARQGGNGLGKTNNNTNGKQIIYNTSLSENGNDTEAEMMAKFDKKLQEGGR